jgi:hypothetical protein
MKKGRKPGPCRELIATAAGPKVRVYSAIVLVCGFIFALGLCFVLRPQFEFKGNLDIVSWITANKYPKQQELFYYTGSLFFVPLFTAVAWALWLLCSAAASQLFRLPLDRTLKKYAFAYLPFALALRNIGNPTFSKTLLAPLILAAIVKSSFLIHDLLRIRLWKVRAAILYLVSPNLHWSVIASGVCVGFFVLIGYSDNTMGILPCVGIILAASCLVWLFWILYSIALIRILKRPIRETLRCEAYSYFPLALLLLVSLFFGNRGSVLILSIILMAFVKSVIIIRPSWLKKLASTQAARYLLDYALIPGLIYVFFYSGGNIHGAIDMFHEGERLAPLNALLRGEIPYRDIYIQHGLFHNAYRPLLAAKLFGPTLEADRILGHLIDPLRHVAFYLLGLQIFKSRLFALLPVWVLASGKTYDLARRALSARNILPIVSIATLAGYVLSHRRFTFRRFHILPALAGVCATLGMVYSLELGLYSLATGSLFLLIVSVSFQGNIRRRLSPLLSYLAGAFTAFLPYALYFSVHGALDDLFRNSFIQCRYHIPIWGLRFPPLFPELSKVESLESFKAFALSETFEWYFPITVYLITLTYLMHQVFRGGFWNTNSNYILLLLVMGGIIFFRTPLGRSDRWHLYGISFAWLICIFFVQRLSVRIWKDARMDYTSLPAAAWRLMAILILAWYVTSLYNPVDTVRQRLFTLTGYQNIERDVEPPLDRSGGIKISDDQASQIKAVVEYIQSNTEPDETIFDFSSQGGYYFFADRPMATRYHQVCYAATRAMQKEVIEDLERHRTRLVIFTTGSGYDSIDGVPNVDRHPLIAEYLKENYTESAKIGNTVILKRIDMEER